MPRELEPTRLPIRAETERHEQGWICRIRTEHGAQPVRSRMLTTHDGELVFSANVYTEDGRYDCCYLRVDADGQLVSALKEDRGVLPKLIEGPDGEIWSIVVDPYGDRDRTLGLPLSGRAQVPEPKKMPANLGELWGDRWLIKHPGRASGNDKVWPLSIAKGRLKRGKAITLEGPPYNHLLEVDDGFEGIVSARGETVYRHVAFGRDGARLRERPLDFGVDEPWHPVVPVRLSFEDESVVAVGGPALRTLTISPDGAVRSADVLPADRMPPEKDIGNIWRPVHGPKGWGIRFNMPTGWAWFDGETPVDVFTFDEDGETATDARDGRAISFGVEGLTIAGVATSATGYRLLLSRIPERGAPPSRELVVLGRDV